MGHETKLGYTGTLQAPTSITLPDSESAFNQYPTELGEFTDRDQRSGQCWSNADSNHLHGGKQAGYGDRFEGTCDEVYVYGLE